MSPLMSMPLTRKVEIASQKISDLGSFPLRSPFVLRESLLVSLPLYSDITLVNLAMGNNDFAKPKKVLIIILCFKELILK